MSSQCRTRRSPRSQVTVPPVPRVPVPGLQVGVWDTGMKGHGGGKAVGVPGGARCAALVLIAIIIGAAAAPASQWCILKYQVGEL